MSNLDRYREPGIEIFQDEAQPLSRPTTIVYWPTKHQPPQQNLREQLQMMRDLQGMQVNEQFGRLALWAIGGSFGVIGLALVASILKGLFAPAPIPMPTPSPSPIVVHEIPNCYAFCSGGSN